MRCTLTAAAVFTATALTVLGGTTTAGAEPDDEVGVSEVQILQGSPDIVNIFQFIEDSQGDLDLEEPDFQIPDNVSGFDLGEPLPQIPNGPLGARD